jgi:hypothetical protein
VLSFWSDGSNDNFTGAPVNLNLFRPVFRHPGLVGMQD